MDYALYIATVLGAVTLFMMMPRRTHTPSIMGALFGAITLGGLWLYLARFFVAADGPSAGGAPMAYYYIFSALAIGSGVRVVTHTKPIYAALWFIMVVLSVASLCLLLEAEFIAMAIVIVYGGAILVTYVFVIMLAAHSGDPQQIDQSPVYDRVARKPLAAVAAGFLLLAVLLSVAFDLDGTKPNAAVSARMDMQIIQDDLRPRRVDLLVPDQLTNAEHVGMDLFRKHPLGLELAGVILLVALVGAVIMARLRNVEDKPSA